MECVNDRQCAIGFRILDSRDPRYSEAEYDDEEDEDYFDEPDEEDDLDSDDDYYYGD